MKFSVYKNIKTKEVVYKEDWQDYALEHLGVTIIPKGDNKELTLEQVEFIETMTEWYFSDNWVKEEIEE